MDLQLYKNDGLELLIDRQSGEVFASQSAVARMCGVEPTQVRRLIGDAESLKSATIKTSNGDKTVKLLSEDLIKTL